MLFIDIETAPHLGYFWGLHQENIGVNQIVRPTHVICAAFTFEPDRDPATRPFAAEWEARKNGHFSMVRRIWGAINEADVLVHYNGTSFDERHLNREFLQAGLGPPSPYQAIDLFRVVKQKFSFASLKLEQVVRELEIREGKIKTDFTLWRRVMEGDRAAQEEMERYNREDVNLMIDLYYALLPWIDRHPNAALFADDSEARCTRCGSTNLAKDGFKYTAASKFQTYKCKDCGGYARSSRRESTTPLREA